MNLCHGGREDGEELESPAHFVRVCERPVRRFHVGPSSLENFHKTLAPQIPIQKSVNDVKLFNKILN